MKKNKKNQPAKKTTLLGGAAKSLKKLGKGPGRLSTTQKVVGGAALVALGLRLLSKRRGGKAAPAADTAAAEQNLAALDGNA